MGALGGPDVLRASVAVEDRLFRALAVVRVAVLVHAVAINAYRNNFDHPVAGWSCIAVMVVWTAVIIGVDAAPERRTPAVMVADLGLAVALLLATPVAKGEWFAATIPGYWITGALLAWAIRFGWRGGTIAAVILGAVDLLSRSEVAQKDWGNVFLLLLGGSMLGYACELLKQMAAGRDAAQREAAAAAERDRLARAVHDGVLQVLALIQRRGAEIGGDAADLGRMAGEQEEALRALIRSQASVSPARADHGVADLAAALGQAVDGGRVQVALPAGTVDVPVHVVDEMTAVVAACVDNVRRHVGVDAKVWILLDDLGGSVEISVRDEGPGIPAGRLAEAAAAGRLGITQSIRGRVEDLGGESRLETSEHGTEWTFLVPKGSR